jgi:hypothetical protein
VRDCFYLSETLGGDAVMMRSSGSWFDRWVARSPLLRKLLRRISGRR